MSAFPKQYKVVVDNDPNSKVRVCWFNHGNLLHNENGPAVEYRNGDMEYRQNGKLHCVGGPATIVGDVQRWYQYDMLHNETGPAVVYSDGRTLTDEYWLEGMEYQKEEWEEEIKRRNGLGLLLSSDKKIEQCKYCNGHCDQSRCPCSECERIVGKSCLISAKVDDQWSWAANPTPPKHPFCGECGLATAYLYSPNHCKGCGTIPKLTPEAIQVLAARKKPHCLRSYCLNGKEECGCPCIDCVADKLVIASMIDNAPEEEVCSCGGYGYCIICKWKNKKQVKENSHPMPPGPWARRAPTPKKEEAYNFCLGYHSTDMYCAFCDMRMNGMVRRMCWKVNIKA